MKRRYDRHRLRRCACVTIATIAFAANAIANDADLIRQANELIGSIPKRSAADDARANLGARLFSNPLLSGDNTMSCVSCHDPSRAFTDGLPLSIGENGIVLKRNTPTLVNVGLRTSFGWDGRGDTLEQQSLEPIANPVEMNQNLEALVEELNDDTEIRNAFENVFGGPSTIKRIGEALAAYQRTLMSHESPFDRFLAGDADAISPRAKDGLEMFLGAAECITCHQGPLLSDGKYYRLGVGSDDQGRGAITGSHEDDFRFRVPTLRNVARTGPYMHDGSKKSLYDVVTFYFRHTAPTGPGHLPLDFEPLLGQSFAEVDAIVAFLETLNDDIAD